MRQTADPRYLQLLARQYPNIQAASSEIIKLQAILSLPKGTEHFMSDLHGEYEAFLHILNNGSGAVREKVDILFQNHLTKEERAELSTLIYYPEEKLEEIKKKTDELNEWYRITLNRLVETCRLTASKYTRSKIRSILPAAYAEILDELINTDYSVRDKQGSYENTIAAIIDTEQADSFINAVCEAIKRLAVDHLHIVGDIFDRGPRPDIIMDSLMEHRSVDIQWGNHDVLWMGAACGSRTCIAVVLNNSLTYNNLQVLEVGYGISLRRLALFANEVYASTDTASCFAPHPIGGIDAYRQKDMEMAAKMRKAIAMIQFKLEGQILRRNPYFKMDDRLLLDKIDYEARSIQIDGKTYALSDTDFPTVDPDDPYRLTEEESEVMNQLKFAFLRSEKLQRHVKFLYSKGGLYKCYNGNLLLHGCMPLNPDGSFLQFETAQGTLAGKSLMDYADRVARQAYLLKQGTPEQLFGKDFLWFLWCGRNSPLFGREKIATFERILIEDSSAWEESKNPYYSLWDKQEICENILREFGLSGEHCHIVNGHVPVKAKKGESPVKANGKLIVIDGGFSQAYQPKTGIAGYTLIYNSWGISISAHEPFAGLDDALQNNKDIISTTVVFDRRASRIKIAETDQGYAIREKTEDLKQLLEAFRSGSAKETHTI